MAGEFNFEILFANGRGCMFDADSVEDDGEKYLFKTCGDTIAEFSKNMIAGYIITGVNEE